MDLQSPEQSDDEPAEAALPGRQEKPCRVDSCKIRHYAKGYCKKHYTQILRHGKLTPERERGVVRVCKVGGCGRTDTIAWYCRKHKRQLRVHGRLTPEREHIMGREGCRVARCKEPHRAKGYCAKHYNRERWRRLTETRAKARGKGARSKRIARKR
ncbi:hypothetical protein HY251_03400 [bacterium]|nr:hypothetical protein [bacterium]